MEKKDQLTPEQIQQYIATEGSEIVEQLKAEINLKKIIAEPSGLSQTPAGEIQIKVEKPQLKISTPPDETNWEKTLDECLINGDSEHIESQSCIDRIESNQSHTRVVPKGGITVITGKPKSCKTKFCYLIAAASFSQSSFNGLLESHIAGNDEYVAIFDTEQSQYDAITGYNTVKKLVADENIHKFKLFMFSFRKFTYPQRLFLLEKFLYANPWIKMLFIDGARDLVGDPNNAEDANKVASLFLKWSTELGIPIVTVIHQNKVDNNVRGHLGSEFVNKADSVIVVEQDGDLYVAKPLLSRGKPFSPMAFRLDDEGTPVIVNDFVSRGTYTSSPETSLKSISEDTHQQVLSMVYEKQSGPLPGWSDLLKALQASFLSISIRLGDNKLREFIAYYQEMGWIKKEPVPGRGYGGYRRIA